VDTPLGLSRLEALLESAELLHSSLELDELLRHLLRSVMGRLVVGRGLVAVEEGGGLRLALVRGARALPAGAPFEEAAARAAGIRHFVPIGNRTPPLGVLGIGAPASGVLADEDREFLRALSGIAASGLANARAHGEVTHLNRRLDQRVQELNTVLELVRALTRADGPEEVAHILGLTLAGQWAVGRSAVLAAAGGHPPVAWQRGTRLPWPAPWLDEVRAVPEATHVADLPDGVLKEALTAERLAVLFPLRSATATFGCVTLGERPGGLPYRAADLRFGSGLVAQAIVALENAWHQREVLARKQFERELALAASIQQGLFPSVFPALERCEVAAANRPAQQVGGDYYDVLRIETGDASARCLFCVADVSGKGIAASLLMSNIQATLRALLGREASLAELARCTNELLYSSTPGNKYVTAILLGVEPATGACRYVNGGHSEGLLLRASGKVERLPPTGLALGMFPGAAYDEVPFTIEAGDLLALYSDGVTEAMNEDEEEFGLERLGRVLRENASANAGDIVAAVLDRVDRFVGQAPQFDDITLLVLKRVAQAEPCIRP
jgi:phosphoserine phosphatase RsbU/P